MSTRDQSYYHAGGKVGVLLLHGLCGTPAEMRYIAMGLSRAGYTVHCPQLAGHGGSRADVTGTGWRDWYVSAEAALEKIHTECDTVVVGGLCLGAILGLHLAANHPSKVQGVALFAPTLWLNGWAMPWYARLLALLPMRLANRMVLPDTDTLGVKCPRTREFIQTALGNADSEMGTAGTPANLVLEHRAMVKAAIKSLKAVTQPTLIVHSREDDHADLSNAHYLQRELGGNVDLLVLDDSYHMITLDRQRHTVLDRTQSFIETLVKQLAKGTRNRAKQVSHQVASAARTAKPSFSVLNGGRALAAS
jgi:carboxylesterase